MRKLFNFCGLLNYKATDLHEQMHLLYEDTVKIVSKYCVIKSYAGL